MARPGGRRAKPNLENLRGWPAPFRYGMVGAVGFGGHMRFWLVLAAVFLPLATVAQPNPPPTPPPLGVRQAAPDRTTQQQLDLPGGSLPFRAVVTTHRLSAGTTPEADIVTTAFLLDVPLTGRPVTFVVNGGPGSASAWLNLLALGPWRVRLPQDGVLPPSLDPTLIVNEQTWLPFTDLVFIDPPGTGYSELVATTDGVRQKYYSTGGDIDALATVIRRWSEANGRLASPKLLVGESYGGFRGPRLARRLAESEGVALRGLMLISPVLDFNGWDSDWQPYAWATRIPAMAAANRHATERDTEAEAYASGPYIADFMRGPGDAAAVARMVERMTALTGLDPALVTRRGGRIDWWTIQREYERGRVASAYDLTITGIDPSPTAQSVRVPDAVVDALKAPVSAAAASLYAEKLNWRAEGAPAPRYEILNNAVFSAWTYGGRQGAAESVGALQAALAFDPAFQVEIVHGLYDLVTPYFGSKLILDQLAPALASRATLLALPGGHMFYINDASRALLQTEGAAMVARAIQ